MAPTQRQLGFAACGTAAALWGMGFFFGKIALREMSVPHMVLYRFLFASVVMLFFLPRSQPSFTSKEYALLATGAAFGIPVQFLLQFHGLALTTLGHAALMVGTMPVILALGAALFLHERLDRTGWIALGASTCGALLIAMSRSHSDAGTASLAGDSLVLVSLALSLFWIVTNKRLMDRHSAGTVSSYGLLLGTVLLAAWVLATSGPPPLHGVSHAAWLSLAASGVLCTASTTLLWNWSITQVPASEAGVFLNMEPMMGSVLSIWLFHERLGWTAWLGGAIIFAAAFVLTVHSKTAVHAAPPAGGGIAVAGIRLIAVDLDGTLVHSSGVITERNQDALRRSRSRGLEMAICTGRRHSYALRALRGLPQVEGEVVISSNGAVTRTATGSLLWRTTLPLPLLRRLCAVLDAFRNALVITYDRFELDGSDSKGALLLEDYDHLHGSIRNWVEINAASIQRVQTIENAFAADDAEEPIQAMLCGGMERMHRAERLIQETFPEDLETFRTEYPGRDLCILDILPKGQSKGTALLQLARSRGVEPDQVLAIGDNWNDQSMLEVAGHSVVLANAPASLKEHALRQGWTIGLAGDEDGVSVALEALLG